MSASAFYDMRPRPLSTTGQIMPGAYYQFYQTETATPAAVYSDGDLEIEHTNPVVADADGRFPVIYLDSSVVYRVQLYDADDVLQYDADPVHQYANMPAGTVVMFHGDSAARDAAYPPALFEVCDGDNGTIDFRGRSPVGIDGSHAQGTTGGSTGTATSTSSGSHDHGAATGSTTLTTSQIPAHRHTVAANVTGSGALTTGNQVCFASNSGGDTEYSMNGTSTDATLGRTSEVGGGTGHTHSITSGGAHTHDVTIPQSPWGALWFLQRKP